MYQVGQAVISKNNGLLYFIHRIEGGGSFNYNYLSNIDGSTLPVPCYDNEIRPATEAEILAESVKHGWENSYPRTVESPLDYYELTKLEKWEWISFTPTLQENLKEYCEEGLVAHRLITSLNLTK